jgi:hypothetical protein
LSKDGDAENTYQASSAKTILDDLHEPPPFGGLSLADIVSIVEADVFSGPGAVSEP